VAQFFCRYHIDKGVNASIVTNIGRKERGGWNRKIENYKTK
jgi:hypothetical protein